MKVLILDGSKANDAAAASLNTALQQNIEARGWSAETIILREQKIGNCAGDFFCWIRTPGTCNVNDDNRRIAARIVQSDLVVYLTPVTFGGYSAELKRMVDHQIQNISPFFARVEGETHHQRRYARYPSFLAVGWMDEANPQAEAIFRNLVYRNSLNFYAKTTVCGLVSGRPSESQIKSLVAFWLQALERGSSSPRCDLPAPSILQASLASKPQNAILLVGSPRTRKSTSYALGSYLMEQLDARGVHTETIQIYTSLNNAEKMSALLEKLDAADLAVLAFPLYVDTLPAPVITLLERITAHRASHPAQTNFAAIANCGFPEAHHNNNALAVCAEFARQNNMSWMGSLALGAGEGVVHGTPLHELDGRAFPIKNALVLAAEALANGRPIPAAAQDLLARPFIPAWLYRAIGAFGWRQQAKRWNAQQLLNRRPYSEVKRSFTRDTAR